VLLGQPRRDDEHPHGAGLGHARPVGGHRRGDRAGVAVQEIDFPTYRQALLDAGQVLDWTDGGTSTGWSSREAWNRDKPGYEWLFDRVDTDEDGAISAAEYRAFREFKDAHPEDWRERIGKGAIGR
jgi:hypothetical protein